MGTVALPPASVKLIGVQEAFTEFSRPGANLAQSPRAEPAVTAVVQLQTFRPTPPASAASASDLVTLARSKATDDRQRLLLGIAALCDTTPPGEEVSPILTDIFLTLARQAESDIRKSLSESLATATWAPPALINMLALDEIEIARPVIANSPLLKDADLLRILVEATIEHQIEVARRPTLSTMVSDAIIERSEPATLTALASNRSADISDDGLHRMVEHARRIAALRAPLTRHPRLNDTLARELYAWVGQALRQALCERFRVDHAAMSEAIDVAVATVGPAGPVAVPRSDAGLAEREEMERRLIAKLQGAGQLRPGFLIRAIREQKLSLFEHGLAALTGVSVTQVRAAVIRPNPDALFLGCLSVGIDRAVFPAVLDEVRKLSGGWPGNAADAYWSKMAISTAAATREFKAMMGQAKA